MERKDFFRSTAFITLGVVLSPLFSKGEAIANLPTFPETLEGNIAYFKYLCKDKQYDFKLLCVSSIDGKEDFWDVSFLMKKKREDKEEKLYFSGLEKYWKKSLIIPVEEVFRKHPNMAQMFRYFVDGRYNEYRKKSKSWG